VKLLILAGGFGTRLQSILPETPKALAPIGGVPFLAFQLEHWIAQGINSFVFLLHHQADQIERFLNQSKAELLRNCEVFSLIEPVPMDTGGAVAYAIHKLGLEGDFLVTNADTWLGSGVAELTVSRAPAMAIVRRDNASRYGQVKFDDTKTVTAFVEKNAVDAPGWINAGIYRLRADMFRNWNGLSFSLEKKAFPDWVKQGELQAIALKTDFIDIGVPEDYQRFCRWVESGRMDKLCN